MSGLKKLAALTIASACLGWAQPALTTIQDTLYRADGSRFNGTITIRWNSFLSSNASNIATSNLTLAIVNGILSVKLTPTTTASPGAQYAVTYNSQGRTQFSETWAVPSSALPLRVRDVRLAAGSVVGPAPVIAPVQISDVVGLANALNVRPISGVSFAPGRAAVINSAGQIDGAAGNPGDCVRVDGTSGACGGAGGSGLLPSFADFEIPAGTLNGVNTVFSLTYAPSPAGSLTLYRNGLLMRLGTDYSLNANIITFFLGSIPQPGDLLSASYRYGNPSDPLGSLTAPQVICSNVGTSTSSTTPTTLATCTIPAGLLGTGDRIEARFHFTHSGTSTGFTGDVRMGGSTLVSRTASASDTELAGSLGVGMRSSGQSWEGQSWGPGLAMAVGAGLANENHSASLTFSFSGTMAGSGSDSVSLENFTVVRYPAQSNP